MVKKSACNTGDSGSVPEWGRSPGEGNGNPLQYSCLENPMDRGPWWATVHGLQSRTWLKWLNTVQYLFLKVLQQFPIFSWPSPSQALHGLGPACLLLCLSFLNPRLHPGQVACISPIMHLCFACLGSDFCDAVLSPHHLPGGKHLLIHLSSSRECFPRFSCFKFSSPDQGNDCFRSLSLLHCPLYTSLSQQIQY